MGSPVESTFQGYISSTHDALLIFECIRRGIMPKVKRRLREDERKLIRSGQVFVFDEKESGIRRWTDGLLWSPSRILWNFLVYRQVEKKAAAKAAQATTSDTASPSFAQDALMAPSSSQSSFSGDQHPLALGAIGYSDPSSVGIGPLTSTSGMANLHVSGSTDNRNRATSSGSDTFSAWESISMLEGFGQGTGVTQSQSQNDPNSERNLVGSLTSSYPFAKGGLCKKTISIHIEGSTQHLISYYTVEDVRSGRLRTPSSLPEIASLAISPAFLTKTSFRFPPAITYGPDGVPRFAGEEGQELLSRRGDQESSGEGTSSGSEAQQFRRQHQIRPHTMQGHVRGKSGTITRNRALTAGQSTAGLSPSISQPLIRAPPMPHQVGGSGSLKTLRRSSDAALRTTRSRYEPYPGNATAAAAAAMLYAASHQQGAGLMGGGAMSMSPSPAGTPTMPFVQQAPIDSSMFNALTEGISGQSSPQVLQQTAMMPAYAQASQEQQQFRQLGSGGMETSTGHSSLTQPQQPMSVVSHSGLGGSVKLGDQPVQQHAMDPSSPAQKYLASSSGRPSSHSGLPSLVHHHPGPTTATSASRAGQMSRPYTASAQLGRPQSDQDPIHHVSAPESFRQAIATAGWDSSAPSTYQWSSQPLPGHAPFTVQGQSVRTFSPASAALQSSPNAGHEDGPDWPMAQQQSAMDHAIPSLDLQASGFTAVSAPLAPFDPSVDQAQQHHWSHMQNVPAAYSIGVAGPQPPPPMRTFSSGSPMQAFPQADHGMPSQALPRHQQQQYPGFLPLDAGFSRIPPGQQSMTVSGMPSTTSRGWAQSLATSAGSVDPNTPQSNEPISGRDKSQSPSGGGHVKASSSPSSSFLGMGSIFLSRPDH